MYSFFLFYCNRCTYFLESEYTHAHTNQATQRHRYEPQPQPHNHRRQPRSANCQRVHENILLFRTQRITSQYDFPELCQREEEQGLFFLTLYLSFSVSLRPLFPSCFFPSPLLLCLFSFPFYLSLFSSPPPSPLSPIPRLSPFPLSTFSLFCFSYSSPLLLSPSPPFPFSSLLYLPLLLLLPSHLTSQYLAEKKF